MKRALSDGEEETYTAHRQQYAEDDGEVLITGDPKSAGSGYEKKQDNRAGAKAEALEKHFEHQIIEDAGDDESEYRQ